jgi:hypothetical protein
MLTSFQNLLCVLSPYNFAVDNKKHFSMTHRRPIALTVPIGSKVLNVSKRNLKNIIKIVIYDF